MTSRPLTRPDVSIRVVVVAGIRPHFVKLAAIRSAIAEYNRDSKSQINPLYLNTGQHYDDQLAGAFIRELDLRFDITLKHHTRRPIALLSSMITGVYDALQSLESKADYVIAIGDANTTLAAAIAAAKSGHPIVHIEAGTALLDAQTQEAINGRVVSQLSTLHFCASRQAVERLAKIGISKNVFLTGDITRDFVIAYSRSLPSGYASYEVGEYVLVTIHRQENLDSEDTMTNLLTTLSNHETKVLFVAHPRTHRRLCELNLLELGNIEYVPALPYGQMLSAVKGCSFIVTDSGGLQREAYYLRKRCLLRLDVEFWPSLTQAGVHRLVGRDQESIEAGLEWMRAALAAQYYDRADELDGTASIRDALEELVVRVTSTLA
jgi:UDP-GlcNAc3NAcA epimerase